MLIVEAWGTRVRIEADDPAWLEEARSLLLPGWSLGEDPAGTSLLEIRRTAQGMAEVRWEDMQFLAYSPEMRIQTVENWLHLAIAATSPRAVFVHAGAVVHRGQGLVIPASSRSGKSTLVHALVQAGATYYSDEFAVLDETGRLHPYPVPLSLRGTGQIPAVSLGGRVDLPPVPVGRVLITRYDPARQEPSFAEIPPGEALMEVLRHAVSARAHPQLALTALARVAGTATFLEGPRGEADLTAQSLLREGPGAGSGELSG